MAITSITRDWGTSAPNVVRVKTTDTLAVATATGYVTAQIDNTTAVNNGVWEWLSTDLVALAASDGSSYMKISSDFTSFVSPNSDAPVVFTDSTALAAPGTIRAVTGSVTNTATTMTSGNLVGVRGVVTLVGASGGFLYGVQGKVISSGTLSGSEWTAGLFGQLDISAATVNAGQTAPVWADYGASSGTITSATGMRMFAGTNTTAATLNSMIYLYGKASNLFELALNGSTYISTGGSGTLSGTIQKIAFTLEGVQYYIPCATVIS